MAPPGSAFIQQQKVLSHHCFVGHTESIQDFLLGVEQSHISATGRKQLQTQHRSVSSSPPQHDPQHISDTQAGQMLIP